MSASLKIKDSTGRWVEVPEIHGESAYEGAVRQGYTGSESDFYYMLSNFSNAASLANTAATRAEAVLSSLPADYTDIWGVIAVDYQHLVLPIKVGTYCTYDGGVYECNTEITVAESFNAAHWTSVVIGNEISDLKSAFSPVYDAVIGEKPYSTASNTYNPNSGNEGNGYPAGTYGVGKCCFDVTDHRGEEMLLYGAQFGYVMQFTDTPGSSYFISGTKFNANKATEFSVTIDSTAKYLAVNVWDSTNGARLCDDTSLPFVAKILPIVDNLQSMAYGIKPIYTGSNTYNPNNGNEGNGYPAGTYGVGKCQFDVSQFVGKTITIEGAQFGWLMQFSGDPGSSNYIQDTKVNIDKRTKYSVTIATGAKYIGVNVWDSTENAVMLTDDAIVTVNDLKSIDGYNKDNMTFVAVGDSITHGTGATSYSKCYFTLLARKLESFGITNARYEAGVSSAASINIAANVGAILNTITSNVTIPDDTSNIEISLDHPIYDAGRNLVKVNPCYLNGIEGTLTKTNSGSAYYFKRNESGDEKFTPSGTAFISNACRTINSCKIAVIFVGTNDGLNNHPENMGTTLSAIASIARQIQTNRYIVVSPYVNSTITDFREALGETYGQRFFDLYNYFSKQAVYDAIDEGLLESGSQDDWSSLLTTDGTHPNDVGHQLIAERIYERMEQIGLLYK